MMVTIQSPFYSAGQKFGWTGSGVGIADRIIRQAIHNDHDLEVHVATEGVTYRINPKKALELSMRYNTSENHKGTIVRVIPLNEFIPQKQL